MFLAQCLHESGGFEFVKENLNYRWQTLLRVFPKYFKTQEQAQQYHLQPQKIANLVYANRMGNGPPESGDGWRYCGRGLIQLTGRENYTWFAASLEITPEEAAQYMETFEGATQSACWFWETNKLNLLADRQDVVLCTQRINGGQNGLQDRIKYYKLGLEVL
jgi:putative chitinase